MKQKWNIHLSDGKIKLKTKHTIVCWKNKTMRLYGENILLVGINFCTGHLYKVYKKTWDWIVLWVCDYWCYYCSLNIFIHLYFINWLHVLYSTNIKLHIEGFANKLIMVYTNPSPCITFNIYIMLCVIVFNT